MKLVSLFCVIFTIRCSSQSIYPFQTWMADLPSSVDFYSNTIFDTILPGSRSSGMVRDDIVTTNSITTSNSVLLSLSAQDQILWSTRQDVSILNQLRSGSRFLDLQIEASGDKNHYNAYNSLLGADISSIIDDIYTFITAYAPDEIIILYLSAFTGNHTQLQGLYDIFSNSNLHSKMVRNSANLTTKTLQNMLDDDTNIIAFTDDLTTPNTFFDSNTFLHIPTTSDANLTFGHMDKVHQVRSFVISNLRHGWPSSALNIIYWTLDIAPSGSITRPIHYNSAFELHNLISHYPKLRFGNVLLVDFIASSDVVEQAIILNYEYSLCHDEDRSTCPSQTSLSTYFKYDDPSLPCAHLNISCNQSCGLCPLSTDIPGSNCTTSADCNSPLYAAFGSSVSGECFLAEPSFCLGLSPYESCGEYDRSSSECVNSSMDALASQCSNSCSADYQCIDGYCNSEWSICMTLKDHQIDATTTVMSLDIFSDIWSYIEYDSAGISPAQYRSDIEMFRPGDPDADYPKNDIIQCTQYTVDCVWETVHSDPYVNSVLGLILNIAILSVSFCICFTMCCPFWCICDGCCKKMCCRPCYAFIALNYTLCYGIDHTMDEPTDWSMHKRRDCGVCLGIVTVIVCAFAIEGIVANNRLYSHIFDESDGNSFVSASNRLFDDIDNKFEFASKVTDFIANRIQIGLDIVEGIVGEDDTSPVHDTIDEMYDTLRMMATNYADGVSLSGQVVNPFDDQITTTFVLPCKYCDTIYDTIIAVNDTLRSESQDTLDGIASIIDSESELNKLKNATDEIRNMSRKLQNYIETLINKTNDTVRETQMKYNENMNKAKAYHTQGQTYLTAVFSLIFVFILCPVIGMTAQSKWCFKMNWCLAMYCAVVLLMICVPFVFILTLSADLCVRLDEFEHALPTSNSRLGRALMNDSALDVIATCFDDGSVLSMFNLSRHKQQMEDALHIDIAASFSMSELDTLQIEMDTLSTDEYAVAVDALIFEANSIPNCQCIALGVPFDRNNLNPATQCTAQLNDWSNCLNALTNASYAVQIENDALIAVEATQKIDALQRDAYEVFAAYHSMSDGANELIDKIQAIGCEVEPLFGELDELLDEFADCRLIGVAYEEFKTIGCGTIFGDVYIIARAVIIIAFFCLLIVLWSLCLDYVYGAIKGGDDVYAPINKAMTVDTPTVDTLDCEFATAYNDKDIEMQSV
eukprot:1149699_1